ncbi:hypothetical protein FRB96_008294 [Tulasnella sp. 330]|nr:hypothetical protein FRB96_008294 [Tulasnella sp. 330]
MYLTPIFTLVTLGLSVVSIFAAPAATGSTKKPVLAKNAYQDSFSQAETDQAFDHLHQEITEVFKKLSKKDQRIIQSKSAEILQGLITEPESSTSHHKPHVKRVIPIATAELAYLVEKIGKDAFVDAVHAGKIGVPTHGPGPAVAAGAGAITAGGSDGMVMNASAMLNKFATYSGVLALGIIFTALALGKIDLTLPPSSSTKAPVPTAPAVLGPTTTVLVLTPVGFVPFFSSFFAQRKRTEGRPRFHIVFQHEVRRLD